MPGQRIGSVIAAVFGLIYVLVNSGPLPTPWTLTCRVLAAIASIAVLVAVFRSGLRPRHRGGQQGRVFGRAYWFVVAVEFVALFGGARLLSGPLDAPEAGVAWVSLVVGTHFFALAVVFGQRFFHGLGGVITGCGVVGLVLAATGAGEPAIALVAGVLPGAVLLGFGWWSARRAEPATGQTTNA
ncbi:hypothetical protein ACLFMI_03265 [Pseudonocardia nantongensis]|uniref:hypothetical protein n=1 Tax=Pseudonocardia nantongensis TaxID=1181885 RepID=UPI003977F116